MSATLRITNGSQKGGHGAPIGNKSTTAISSRATIGSLALISTHPDFRRPRSIVLRTKLPREGSVNETIPGGKATESDCTLTSWAFPKRSEKNTSTRAGLSKGLVSQKIV